MDDIQNFVLVTRFVELCEVQDVQDERGRLPCCIQEGNTRWEELACIGSTGIKKDTEQKVFTNPALKFVFLL